MSHAAGFSGNLKPPPPSNGLVDPTEAFALAFKGDTLRLDIQGQTR